MKKVMVFVSFLWLTVLHCSAQLSFTEPKSILNFPAFAWDETAHDFGKIKRDEPVTHVFQFTNKGTIPITISGAATSCGCTASEYTKEAISPGKTGMVKVTFNAATPGFFSKNVTITSNVSGSPSVLSITGEVIK